MAGLMVDWSYDLSFKVSGAFLWICTSILEHIEEFMTPTTGVRPGFAHRHVLEGPALKILQTCKPMPIDSSAVEPHSVALCT